MAEPKSDLDGPIYCDVISARQPVDKVIGDGADGLRMRET